MLCANCLLCALTRRSELDGSGKIYASQIGSDYDWSNYGWKVIFNPTFEQLRAGDVINWELVELL